MQFVCIPACFWREWVGCFYGIIHSTLSKSLPDYWILNSQHLASQRLSHQFIILEKKCKPSVWNGERERMCFWRTWFISQVIACDSSPNFKASGSAVQGWEARPLPDRLSTSCPCLALSRERIWGRNVWNTEDSFTDMFESVSGSTSWTFNLKMCFML